jgi:hypothetical protein
MVQEVIGQSDPNLRSCVHADPISATSVAVAAHLLVMSVVHSLSPGKESAKDSILDPRTSERSDQVIIDRDKAQPSGKSHLPVVGVPGFPGSIFGPSASSGVHDRSSLIMAGEKGGHFSSIPATKCNILFN